MRVALRLAVVLFWLGLPLKNEAQVAMVDSLGLPGDHLNLYGVLELFKQSASLEFFEESLNKPDTYVNNLDLNNDNVVDYIKITELIENQTHVVVLQTALTEFETQDVAVIYAEREERGIVTLQIVGNEELYGHNYLIEPAAEGKVFGKEKDDHSVKAMQEGETFHFYTLINPTTNNITSIESTGEVDDAIGEAGYWPILTRLYHPLYVQYVSRSTHHIYPYWWQARNPMFWQPFTEQLLGAKPKHVRLFKRIDQVKNGMAHQLYIPIQKKSTLVNQNLATSVYAEKYLQSQPANTSVTLPNKQTKAAPKTVVKPKGAGAKTLKRVPTKR